MFSRVLDSSILTAQFVSGVGQFELQGISVLDTLAVVAAVAAVAAVVVVVVVESIVESVVVE